MEVRLCWQGVCLLFWLMSEIPISDLSSQPMALRWCSHFPSSQGRATQGHAQSSPLAPGGATGHQHLQPLGLGGWVTWALSSPGWTGCSGFSKRGSTESSFFFLFFFLRGGRCLTSAMRHSCHDHANSLCRLDVLTHI